MAKIELEIKSCKDCPFIKMERRYGADSWEETHDWYCSKESNKEIETDVEWRDVNTVPIPKWCPILVK